ncbi:putative transmembrane protein INAFM1 [Cyprinodon tularosa]|uniref:putative transmembrane protein INAFM1 n=1 Tax=Cyprinodon tularosa TaxID=77115 RepID=UPI0018E26E8E|nr:putative transmembrane protein INAFM1 [Cyprinodon tularosa]
MRDQSSWSSGFGAAGRRKAAPSPAEQRRQLQGGTSRRWLRMATVLGYMLAVCLVSVLLVLYYGVFWKPTSGPGAPPSRSWSAEEKRRKCGGTPDCWIHGGGSAPRDFGNFTTGGGSPQAARSSPEAAAVTQEDPSNLPTHRTGTGRLAVGPEPEPDPRNYQ